MKKNKLYLDPKILDEAVIIKAVNNQKGIEEEYKYLDNKYGKRGKNWSLISQKLRSMPDKAYDIIEISLNDNTTHTICFDITDFFGKH